MGDADAALLMLNAEQGVGPGDRFIAGALQRAEVPVVVAINKVDRIDHAHIVAMLQATSELEVSDDIFPISARKGSGVDALVEHLCGLLPEGEFMFEADDVSDQPESVMLAEQAIAQAAIEGAGAICFPECYIPGYRGAKPAPPPDAAFLERAWSDIAAAAAKASIAVVLGTERIVDDALLATALVVNRDGTIAGFQDKVQIDPSEEGVYSPGSGRRTRA